MKGKNSYAVARSGALVVALGIFCVFSSANAQFEGGGGRFGGGGNSHGSPSNMGPGGQGQNGPQNGQRGGMQQNFSVPKGAIDACSTKSEKDTCSFTITDKDGNDKDMSGKCAKSPKNDDSLACMPERKDEGMGENRMPGGGMGFNASEESIAACSDKSEKDECSFTRTNPNSDEETTVSGTCSKVLEKGDSSSDSADEGKLVCVPERKDGDNSGVGSLERAQRMKREKTREIYRIESRTEKLIDFLKSKDVGVNDINGDYDTFKTNADALLADYDSYIALLKDSGSSDSDKTAALDKIKSAGETMRVSFESLKSAIRSALDSLKDSE